MSGKVSISKNNYGKKNLKLTLQKNNHKHTIVLALR